MWLEDGKVIKKEKGGSGKTRGDKNVLCNRLDVQHMPESLLAESLQRFVDGILTLQRQGEDKTVHVAACCPCLRLRFHERPRAGRTALTHPDSGSVCLEIHTPSFVLLLLLLERRHQPGPAWTRSPGSELEPVPCCRLCPEAWLRVPAWRRLSAGKAGV